MDKSPLKVACYVPTFNAGDTTRGIEITLGLVETARRHGRKIDAIFICPPIDGPNFEATIVEAGFEVGYTNVPLSAHHIDAFMKADRTGEEFVVDPERAKLYIEGYMEDMIVRRPDLVLYGCLPPAGIAAQILGLPSVSYLPFPADERWMRRHLLKDIPDDLENALTVRAPDFVRRQIKNLASRLAHRKAFFTQPTLARAGQSFGWAEARPNLFSMLKADVEIVPDFPDFYEGQSIGPCAKVTGPLFARSQGEIHPRVRELFDEKLKRRILITMGSSGEKSALIESIKSVSNGDFNVVAIVQPTICTLTEVERAIRIPANVYLTDAFLPAQIVTPMADIAIIHGGQGTVQTTLASGVPFVGVAMQAEQQTNLDNAARAGAGVRLTRRSWRAPDIRETLERVLDTPEYRICSARFARKANDGRAQAGEAIWAFLESSSRDSHLGRT